MQVLELVMKSVIVVIGAGSIGQAIANPTSFSGHHSRRHDTGTAVGRCDHSRQRRWRLHRFRARITARSISLRKQIIVPQKADVYLVASEQAVANRPGLVEVTISTDYLVLDGKQIAVKAQTARPTVVSTARPEVAKTGRPLAVRLLEPLVLPDPASSAASPATQPAAPPTSP